MMQTILLALVITWNAFPASSQPCFCVMPEVPEAFEQAKAVFVGEVIEIIEPITVDEKAASPDRFYVVRFKVEKSWKGAFLSSEIDVLSDQGGGSFAFPKVAKGERYLVYAEPAFESGSESRRFLIITNCNRTAMLPASINPSKQRRLHLELDRQDGSVDLRKLDAIVAMPPKRRA
jgi:hypothetical protein